MAGQTLALFQVPAASRLEPGDDPDKCKLTPVEDLKVLKLVADEEGSQHKGMYYAMQKLHIFGVAEPESSHPKWNSFRKAMEHSGMTISAMKLTLCCYQTASSISHFRPLEPFQKITN
ncbi:Uncharacterized protein SCF082_LOCUS39773 [Durusdinium trenchii]|uniref:Uncharacterized protein n=1 Tax=Durusdinium trenchii TaxID=1381693 RepID=A0ABP0Q9Z3_9DINO